MAKETFERSKPNLNPNPPPPTTPTGGTACKENGLNVDFAATFTGGDVPDQYWIIKATSPMAQGIMAYPESRLKVIKSVENVGLLGVIDFTTEYTERFGQIEIGNKIAINLSTIDVTTGQVWDQGTFFVTGKPK